MREPFLVLAAAVATCNGPVERVPVESLDQTAPFVLFTSPASSATGVPLEARVSVTFSEPMDPASLVTCLALEGPAGPVPGTVTPTADGLAVTFAPATVLEPLAGYAATLAAGPRDRAGNAAAPARWAFRTAAVPDAQPPRILARAPAPGGVVDPAEARSVTVTFDEPLDCATLPVPALAVLDEGAPVAGQVTCSGATLTFQPTSGMLPTRTTLEVVVAPLVSDLAGNPLGAPHRWTVDVLPWLRQVGTPWFDEALAVAVAPDGDVAIVGRWGRYVEDFLELDLAHEQDVLLVRYDRAGVERWRRLIATDRGDEARGVAMDGAGNVFVAGATNGALPGYSNPMGSDPFLLKYDAQGTLVWSKQIEGTGNSVATAIAASPSGEIYVAFWTDLGCVLLGDAAKDPVPGWIQAFESAECTAMSLDGAGGLVVAVRGYGTGMSVSFVMKLGAEDGSLKGFLPLWGGSPTHAKALAVDSARNVYVAGYTTGVLFGPSAGAWDLFVAKLDPEAGTTVWTVQRGTNQFDMAYALAVDGDSVWVGGSTGGDLERRGWPRDGTEAFVLRYDSSGTESWARQGGSLATANSLAADGQGGVYVAGQALSFGSRGAGCYDFFLTKIDAGGRWR